MSFPGHGVECVRECPLCVDVCARERVCMYMCVCIHVNVETKDQSQIIPPDPSLFFFGTGSLRSLGQIGQAWLFGQQAPGIPCLLPTVLGLQVSATMPRYVCFVFKHAFWV